jgi:hypothetical protein
MTKYDLPNTPGVPNINNLTNERQVYETLYNTLARTTTGTYSFTSTSSGVTYSTNDYPADIDIFNKGQSGMVVLLAKYVLIDFMIKAAEFNQIGTDFTTHLNEKATSGALGHVRVDNTTIQVDGNGIISTIDNNINSILLRDILRIKMRQTGLNLDPNAWSDSLEDNLGLNMGSTTAIYDSGSKSLKLISDTDIATTGGAISGGDGGSNPKTNAFDNNASTYWGSSQLTTATIVGTSYIGQDFGVGVTKRIQKFKLNQWNDGTASVTSVKVQCSDNGSSWTDVQTISVSAGNAVYALTPHSQVKRYWRLLANAAGTLTSGWLVYEVEFFEGVASPANAVWIAQSSEGTLKNAVVEAVENLGTGTITYSVSRNNGANFTTCPLDSVTDISGQPNGTSIVLKAVITGNAELLGVAWGGEV